MKQVLINSRGEVRVVDLPAPALEPGQVLVRTAYSVISSGTEFAMLRHHSAGMVKRALARPDVIRRLGRELVTQGMSSVREQVEEHLARQDPLGYSLAGEVLEIGLGIKHLRPGDRVACAGAEYAHHAEIVSIPALLAVPVPEGVELRQASFAAISAIALHAVRRSQAVLGETVVVIGLGLVGLLACQLLRAAGCLVIGLEPNPSRRRLAENLGCKVASAEDSAVSGLVGHLTGGLGADAIIITAATESSMPVNQAASLARERGRVVVVGDVGLDLKREEFYRGELDLSVSRSLGPGRYDYDYEERGVDYPPAFVRWTEARNMEACLGAMASGRLDPIPLISAEFPVGEAAGAYLHLSRQPDAVAAVLQYEADTAPVTRRVTINVAKPLAGRIGVGIIGAGQFARAVHLPLLRRSNYLSLRGVVSRNGSSAHHVAGRFRLAYAATDPAEMLADVDVQVVWITTPHDSHASLAVQALEAGKHVFVEKPLALRLEDCLQVADAVRRTGNLLTVGFNRRFAPASEVVREHFAGAAGSKQVLCRVRADVLPEAHWANDPARGGGFLLGEAVHFFDWMSWFLGEEPHEVWATSASSDRKGITVVVQFSRGSTGTLVYFSGGALATPKERIEIAGGGLVAIIDNFQGVELYKGSGRPRRARAAGKGFEGQLRAFTRALHGETPLAVTVEDGVRATACALAAETSIRDGKGQRVIMQDNSPAAV